MDRWWTDSKRVEEFSKSWSKDDDPQMLVGSALLALHAVGNKHLQNVAVDVIGPFTPHRLRLIDDDPLIGPICKAFDDASGIPGYGAQRVAQLKRAADAGVVALVSGLRAEKVPEPLAISRAGLLYGVTAPEMKRLSHSMKGHDLVANKAADQALMKWASFISEVESDRIEKAEKDTFQVGGKTRTAYRDEESGEFVSAGDSDEALSPAEAKKQRLEAKRAAYMQQAAQRKAKAASLKAGAKQTAPATEEAVEEVAREVEEVEQKSKEKGDWQKWHAMRRAAASRQERFAAEEAQEADVRRASRRGAVAEAEARQKRIEERLAYPFAVHEARTAAQTGKQTKGSQKSKGQAGTKTDPQTSFAVAYDSNNPARTAHMFNDGNGGSWVMPSAFKAWAKNEEMYPSLPRDEYASVISMYSGRMNKNASDTPADAVKRALLTKQWMDITQRDQSNVPGGFGFLIDQRAVADQSDEDLVGQFTAAAIETLDGHASDNGLDVGDARSMRAMDRSIENVEDYVQYVIEESSLVSTEGTPLLLRPSMNSTDLLKLMLDRGGFAADQAAPLTRALQIRRLTDEPDKIQPIESILMTYEDAFMPYQVMDNRGNVLATSLDSNSGFESSDTADSMRESLTRAMQEAISKDPLTELHVELMPLQSGTGINPKSSAVLLPIGNRARRRVGMTGGSALWQNPLSLSIPGMDQIELPGTKHAKEHLGLADDPVKDSAAYLYGGKEA